MKKQVHYIEGIKARCKECKKVIIAYTDEELNWNMKIHMDKHERDSK